MHDADSSGVRLGQPGARDLSRQLWVGERSAAILQRAAADLRERCEPFTPLSVFLGGSAVHGELCGIEAPGGQRSFLSDLDLGIVTERRIPPGEQQEIARRVREEAEPGPEVRAGFYCREDLGRQDPTPGLVETVHRGFVLYGDPAVVLSFRVPRPDEIPPWEGRRLLANRAIEWLAASRADAGGVRRVYTAAKLAADCGTVLLVARGAYRGGGYAARVDALASLEGTADEDRERIAAWSRWRLEPSWDTVPCGGDVDHAAGSTALAGAVARAIRGTMRFCSGADAPRGFLRRPPTPARVWGSSWKRWIDARPGTIRWPHPRDLARTPRVLLWESALEMTIGHPEAADEILRRLTGARSPDGSGLARRIVEAAEAMEREGIE